MMQPIPDTVKGYGILLMTGAIALLGVSAQSTSTVWLAPDHMFLLLVFAVLIALAGRFPLHVSSKRKAVVDSSLIFGALLLFPAPWGPLVAGLGVLAGLLVFRRVPLDIAINTGETVIEVVCAQAVYLGLGGTIPAQFEDVSVLVPLMGAGLAALTMNRLLVAVAVSLHLGINPARVFYSSWGGELKEDVALLLLGVLTAMVVQVQPWALALTVIPVALVYISLRNSLRLKILTRDAVEALADLIDRRDQYTAGHSLRVAKHAERLAVEMGLPWDAVETIRAAARVHDLGKIGIEASTLTKRGRLTEEEWEVMRRHPEAGAEIVSRFPEFAEGADYVRYHHERWDGRGYPRGLRAEEIPLGARIIAVADTFDAMTSDRPYRKALALGVVMEEFKRGAGFQWDEQVVAALFRILDQDHARVSERRMLVPAEA